MNENIETKVEKLRPFSKFCMTIGQLPTSYIMSMSYLEQLTWLCHYLKDTVIPVVNNNAEAVEEIQRLYTELQSYVDNYFENLNVTDEINNKLDEMASNGTLYAIIRQYTDPIINQQNARITQIENEIESVSSGSPLVATSTDEMTDTSRVYVNTTDGKWYYYDGDSWEIGGTYQSTGISDNSIYYNMLESALQKGIVISSIETADILTIGSFYTGNVGSAISLTASNQLASGVMNVNPNDLIIVPFIEVGTTYDYINPIILTDGSDIIVQKFTINDVRPETGIFTLKIPSNVAKVYWNCKINNSPNMRWYPYIVKEYNYLDERVTNNLTNKVEIEVNDETLEGIYSHYYWGYPVGSYFTRVYDVNPLDKINLQTTIANATILCAGVFVNSDGKPIEWVTPKGNATTSTTVNEDVIVPASATQLYVTVQNSSVVTKVYNYTYADVDLSQIKKMSVTYNDGVLVMTNNSNNNTLTMKHSTSGNNLFEIVGYSVNGTSKTFETDMIPSPYIVKAINNINGDRTFTGFTGGQHKYSNNEYDGTKTAEEISLAIYVDNRNITSESNITLQGNEVKIVEVNRVQATNTCLEAGNGRNVLEEQIVFTYDGRDLDVVNTITPLEDINLMRYYGIQTASFSDTDYKIYGDKVYNVNTQLQCPSKPDVIYGGNIISSKLYPEVLGKYQLNSVSRKVNISSGKSYYVPVYTETQNLISQGSVQYIHGCYTFDYIQK